MSGGIIETPRSAQAAFTQWLQSPAGRHLHAWESAQYDDAVADVFGFYALQLGLPALATLGCNRMPHRWCAQNAWPPLPDTPPPGLLADFTTLPFDACSLDLVTLPHTLELCHEPHALLAEVHRVLMPEGKLVLSCLNPVSWWGLRQARTRLYRRLGSHAGFLPDAGEWLGQRRLRDWLRLLNFEVESVRFGCHQSAWRHPSTFERAGWLDRLGQRWWPILGNAYVLVATKRERGVRLIGPATRRTPVAAPAAVATTRNAGVSKAPAPGMQAGILLPSDSHLTE